MRSLPLLLLLAATVPAALAEPDGALNGPLGAAHEVLGDDVEYASYEVSGAKLKDLPGDFQGPPGDDGKPTAGSAQPAISNVTDIDGSVTAKQDRACPRGVRYFAVSSATVAWSLSWTVTLPTWKEFDSASAAGKAEWERFLKAVRAHEEGHVADGSKAFADAKPNGGPFEGKGDDCDPAVAVAKADAAALAKVYAEEKRLADAVDAAGAAHDAETDHGASEGATLQTGLDP